MKRILILVLWIIPILGPQAHGDIEIYVNGHKYGSIQEYLQSKRIALEHSQAAQVALNSQDENYIRQEAKQLGIKVDFSKVKTLQISNKYLSNRTMHDLYVLSVENGVTGALKEFYQAWGQPEFQLPRKISSGELQKAIQEAVTTSKVPKLLISEPGKVRIMTLEPDEQK